MSAPASSRNRVAVQSVETTEVLQFDFVSAPHHFQALQSEPTAAELIAAELRNLPRTPPLRTRLLRWLEQPL